MMGPPPGLSTSSYFLEALGPIGQISQTEGYRNEVKGFVFECKFHAIPFDELVGLFLQSHAIALFSGLLKHGRAKIHSDNFGIFRQSLSQGKGRRRHSL